MSLSDIPKFRIFLFILVFVTDISKFVMLCAYMCVYIYIYIYIYICIFVCVSTFSSVECLFEM
jgi:hypothetical protein